MSVLLVICLLSACQEDANFRRHRSIGALQSRGRLRSYGLEAQDRKGKEQPSHQPDDHEFRPNRVDAGAAVEDRLRKRYEMR